MKVFIEKDEQGQFFVGMDTTGMAPTEPAPNSAQAIMPNPETQPAKDLQEALMLAGRLLSQPGAGEQSLFDAGMAKTISTRQTGVTGGY